MSNLSDLGMKLWNTLACHVYDTVREMKGGLSMREATRGRVTLHLIRPLTKRLGLEVKFTVGEDELPKELSFFISYLWLYRPAKLRVRLGSFRRMKERAIHGS